MLKAFQYRLYPSKTQERKLEATRETCRRWYNELLAERKTAYEERGETVGKYAQLRRVKAHKASNPWAAVVHSHVLQVVVADLDKAFQAFFRRLKAGEAPGYPRFKGCTRFASFGFKEYGNGLAQGAPPRRAAAARPWHRTDCGALAPAPRGQDQDLTADQEGQRLVCVLHGGDRGAAAGGDRA